MSVEELYVAKVTVQNIDCDADRQVHVCDGIENKK